MLTETFINCCYSVVLNKNSKIKRNKTLYRDIINVLLFTRDKKTIEIPVNVQNKVDCLEKICKLKLDDKSDDNILDSISISEKYKQLQSFLETKIEEELSDNNIVDNIKQIRLRKKINSLFSNYDQLKLFIDSYNEGSFDSLDDVVLDYENIIKQLYSNMMENSRDVSIEAAASLDLAKDDYTSILERIKMKYQRKNTTPTGYQIFDNDILTNGGFERSRLYVFGGGSGAGKSTMLSNLINNSATTLNSYQEEIKDRKFQNVYIYITLENSLEEALLRVYQALFRKTLVQSLADVSAGVDIKQKILDELKKNKSTVIMKYYPASTISTTDVMMVLDDVIHEFGKETIRGLYIDYLDLLRTDMKFDQYRIELGHITLSLKIIAVQYNIPVITATQLNRSVYKVQESNELGLDHISESIKKVEHADFVALLSKDPVDDSLVHMKIGKNRSGRANVTIDFKVDFQTYKYINGYRTSASKPKKEKQNTPSVANENLITPSLDNQSF
jgi:replicative DNA helicase